MRDLDWTSYDVLVVDDEPDNLDAFRFAFRKSFRLHYAGGGDAAVSALATLEPAVIVADQRMPGMSGIELLRHAKRRYPDTYAILLTAYADLEVLIDAVNSGAVDRYVPKPWDSKEFAVILRQGITSHVTLKENRRMREQLAQYAGYLEKQQRDPLDFGQIIGQGSSTQAVLERVEEVSPTATPVLIEGEAGLEKDVIARAIHIGSPRENMPFVNVTCAAFPDESLERELFGYRPGAFEGAFNERAGRTELADGGTLYLHEPTALSPSLQARLLALLTGGHTERIGDTASRAVDVRVLVSVTPDLGELGELLPELRSRLSVFPIRLKPLRERREDVRELAEHFLRKYAQRNARAATQMAAAAVARLEAYSWPGNVRELHHALMRAAIVARGTVIGADHLILDERENGAGGEDLRLETAIARHIRDVLEQTEGDEGAAAALLGISRAELHGHLGRAPTAADEPSAVHASD